MVCDTNCIALATQHSFNVGQHNEPPKLDSCQLIRSTTGRIYNAFQNELELGLSRFVRLPRSSLRVFLSHAWPSGGDFSGMKTN